MIKSVRITKANKEAEWNLSDERFALAKAKGSTGEDQKRAERDIRDMINVEGITYTGDLRARTLNRDDICVKDKHGDWVHIEVKHGGGPLAYAWSYKLESFDSRDRDLCLQNIDYVCYRLKADLTKRTAIALEYRVSTREDFLDMLEEYCHGKRSGGFETATKFGNAKHDSINIQSMYAPNFWEGMKNDPRAMCLWDFCTYVLGRDPRWER